jgi:hypothetical protein
MWRTLASGGALVHAATTSWSFVTASMQNGPGGWLVAGLTAAVPGLCGLGASLVLHLLSRPPEKFIIEQQA